MKVFILALICGALLWPGMANAQRSLLLRNTGTAVTAPYVGPADIVSGAYFWIGARGYNAAYSGKALNVCNAADANCADFNITNGVLVPTLLGTTDCTQVTTCTVKILYDQSGNTNCSAAACDFTQTTIASRASLVSCFGSRLALSSAGGVIYTSPTITTLSQPFTYSLAYRNINVAAQQTIFTGATPNYSVVGSDSSGANNVFQYSGPTATAPATDAVSHSVQMTWNGASSELYVDGSATANAAALASGLAGVTSLLSFTPATQPFSGCFAELGVWSGTFTAGNKANMNTNQHSYWGF